MMIRLLHLLSGLAVIAAGGVLVLCAAQWRHSGVGSQPPSTYSRSLQGRESAQASAQERVSPLMAAAQGFASYLSPPPPPVQEKPAVQEAAKPVAAVVRPAAAVPQFKVRGTICAGPLEQSIALIWEPSVSDAGRWMKEGAQVGHFTIHEIRPGSIVYLDGDKLCEMAIEREARPATTTTAVADGSPATAAPSRKAVGDAQVNQTPSRSKRPTGSRNYTVGSTRTTTID